MDNLFVATAIGHEPLHSEIAAQCGIEAGQGQSPSLQAPLRL